MIGKFSYYYIVDREPGRDSKPIGADSYMEAAMRFAAKDYSGMGSHGYFETLWVRQVYPTAEAEPGQAICIKLWRSTEQERSWDEEREPDPSVLAEERLDV